MRIERLAIEGFGRLHQQEIDLDSPATVVLGPNEAGKSTAAAFIRTMLYGFPQRRNGVERHEPLAGGRHGGRLVLTTDRGERLTIERLDLRDGLRIWDEQGSLWSESELHRAIGGYQGDLFRRMFAFSLSELQEVRLLESEDVSRYLYMVGLGNGGGKSILEAERRLSAEMERLFKHRGSVQLIPQKAREVEELAAKLQAARGQSEAYNALLEQLQACEQAMQTAEEGAKRVRAELNWLEACVEAREDWIAFREVEERLAALPEPERPLPEDAIERLNQWREQAARLREEEQRARHAREQGETERAAIQLVDGREQLRRRLEPLLERLASAADDLDRLKDTRLELQALEEAVARSVRAVAPHWTAEQLRAYPMSQAEVEQVRAFRDAQARLRAAAERLDAERREREARCQQEAGAWEEADGDRKRLLEERRRYPELAALPYAERVRLIRQFNREAARWAELDRECRHVQDRLADAAQLHALRREGPSRSARGKRQPPSMWAAGLTLAGFGAAAAGLAGFGALGEWGWAALSAALGGLLAAAARLGPWSRQRRREDMSHQPAIAQDPAASLQKQLQEWEQRREQAAAGCLELLSRLLPHEAFTAAAQEAGEPASGYPAVGSSVGESALSALAGRSEYVHAGMRTPDHWAAWRESLEELLPLEEQLDLNEGRLRERERALHRAREELALTLAREAENKEAYSAERERWEEWLARRDLPRDASPEAALVLLQTIDKGQETAARAVHCAKQAAELQGRVAAFDAEVRALLQDFPAWRQEERELPMGEPAVEEQPDAAAWTSCLKALQHKLREQEELARRAERLEEQLSDLRANLAALEEVNARIARERSELLREVGAGEEDELRRQAEREIERRGCMEQKRHLAHVLQVRLGGRQMEHLDQVWQSHTLPEIGSKRELLARQLQDLTAEKQELAERKARLQTERDRLIRDEEYAALLQDYKEAKTELRELAAQWTVRAMAQEWFRAGRETYEQERQPAVMRKASARFAQMTDGAYSRVYTKFGDGRLEVEHASGTRMDPGQLSRGTCEQLLLAIRFAVAEETADRIAMPLLMDDVFVNFDPMRLERCWDIVREISERHQIVYFTCHPHIAEMAERRIPAVRVLRL